MKKILPFLVTLFLGSTLYAQTYTAGTVGLQNTYVSHCQVNTCSGTFVDDGGAGGNYSLNINNIYRTFCPATPGQCLTITFNTFSIEPPSPFCWDLLSVIDSPTQNGPLLGSGCGTSLQGMSFTSNNPSGCISIRFNSDNIITAAGWSATISCGGCGAGAMGGPSANLNTDCINAQFVCDSGTPITATSQGPGLTSDACVSGCVLAENYSNWYIVNVTTAGLMGLVIDPNPNAADYDFALYGPVVGGCGALGAPIRCSYAANTGNTGMITGAGDFTEDVTGNGWVESANLAVGTYYLLINQWDAYPSATFQLDFTGTAVVGLPPLSPVTYNPVSCSNSVLQLNAPTIPGATYSWTGPGGFTSNLQNPTRNPVVAGTYNVTYSVNGCTSPAGSVNVTIPADVTPPTITCPANQTLNLGAACNVAIPNYTGLAVAADNCGILSVTQSPVAGTLLVGAGTTVVTLTATDLSGNTTQCTFNVVRNDITPPTITCPGTQTLNLGAGCNAALPNYTGMATTGDNCGVASVTQSPIAGTTVSGVGTTVVTLTVTDVNGLTTSCNFNVNRVDVTAPTITCPGTQTVNLGAGCNVALPNYVGMATTGDNCGVASVTQSPVAGTNLIGVGTTVVTLTVTDNSGNSTNCTFNVNRVDVTNPTITCPGTQTLNLNASCGAVIPNYTGLATTGDNCGVASVTQSPVAGTNVSGVGTTVVTLTVTDNSGNSTNCTFNVNRVDVTAPVINCPGNQNVAANASCQFIMPNYTGLATTSDNCSPVTVTQSPAIGATVSGTQTVTLTGTDASGNSSNCTFQVIVIDNTPPTLTCPPNQTGNVGASCLFSIPNYTALATATDNCTATPTITQSPVAGTVVGVGTHIITLTATDANGNISTPCSFNVVVTDNTPPVVICPLTQTLNLDASCNGVLANYVPFVTVSDNCAIASVTQSPAAGSPVTGIGTTVITITATDVNGQVSTCTFNVNRVDVTPPTITCPGNQTATADASCQFTLANYTGMATTSDNCSPVTVTQSPAIGATVSGTQTVTLTATDASGNSSNCTFQVVVSDNTAPVISGCPPNTTGTANASCQFVVPNFTGSVTVTDNCTPTGSLTITQNPAAGSLIGLGTTVVTITVLDANGNSSNCTFNIVVSDALAPVLTCPANQTLSVDASCSATLLDYTSLGTAIDNCGGSVTITQSPIAGTTINGSGVVTVVTLTATDGVGNSSTCSFNVTTTDNTNPVFVACPSNQNESPDANCQFTLPNYTSLSIVSDNCTAPASITITQSPVAGTVITGTTTITLTATDGSGNSATCTFSVILADNTPPTIAGCPATLNVIADNSCAFVLPDYTSLVTVDDNCGGSASVTVTQSPAIGSTIGSGTTLITLTATDANGNASTCTFNVTVADTIAPTINCTSNITTCNPVVNFVAPTANDNCGSATVTQTDVTGLSSGSTFPIGTTTLQYTASDASGNTSVCSFTVTVEAQPSVSVVGADIVLCDTVTSVTISANAPTNGTGSWVLLSGSGTFGNSSNPVTTLSGLSIGTTQVAWVISNGSCTPSSDDLTITMSQCFDIIIPTGFTPDGDGTNDVWDIQFLDLYYPNCHVEVFNRWGAKLFESDGYANPWDGTFKGNPMPVSSYYFVIDLGDGSNKIKGTVTIIK